VVRTAFAVRSWAMEHGAEMRITPEQAEKMGLVRSVSGDWMQPSNVSLHHAPVVSRAVQRESDLHEEIVAFCRSMVWPCHHSRMDRPATCGVGTPDFAIAIPGGVTVWVEAKAKGGKLRPEQAAWLASLRRVGHVAEVVHSMDEFRSVIGKAMQTKKG